MWDVKDDIIKDLIIKSPLSKANIDSRKSLTPLNPGVDDPLEQVESPTVGVWASRMLTVSTTLSAASTAVPMSVREQVSQEY